MSLFEIQETLAAWLNQPHPPIILIGTVVQTWGSSPRRVGAKLATNAQLEMVGSVSGGCVESDVLENAKDMMLKVESARLLHYEVSDDTALGVGLACGGSISIFLESIDPLWWFALQKHLPERLVTVTRLPAPAHEQDKSQAPTKVLFDAAGQVLYQSQPLPVEITGALRAQVVASLENARASRQRIGGLDLLFEVHLPPPRLIIIGGAHVSIPLHQMAAMLGFEVYVIDPRRAFASPRRFPHAAHLIHRYPDAALKDVPLDADTYVVVVSHDPKIDDPALDVALRSDVAYVGVMSSRRTHEKRLEGLRKRGLSAAQLARIHSPIGLNIRARNPEEIALSIMAEVVALRNGAGGKA